MLQPCREGWLYHLKHRLRRRWISLDYRFRNKFQFSTIRSLYGPRFCSNFGDVTFRLYIKGSYGFFYWDHLTSIDRPFVFLDVGANQGLYSICAASNPFLKKCFSFEPVPKIADLLNRNISLNQVQDRCTVIEKAVSAKSGVEVIHLPENHSGAATISDQNKALATSGQELEIETIDSEELNRMIPLSDDPIFVKVDVEGHESVVIGELLKSRFASRIREIFYEMDDQRSDRLEIQELLESHGFELSRIGDKSHHDVLAVREGSSET